MPSYLATWSVFVLDVDDPIDAAVVARGMADEHHRSLWGIEEVESGDTVTVDVEERRIIPTEDLDAEVA